MMRYWIIVKGYDEDIARCLGIHFKIHQEMYQVRMVKEQHYGSPCCQKNRRLRRPPPVFFSLLRTSSPISATRLKSRGKEPRPGHRSCRPSTLCAIHPSTWTVTAKTRPTIPATMSCRPMLQGAALTWLNRTMVTLTATSLGLHLRRSAAGPFQASLSTCEKMKQRVSTVYLHLANLQLRCALCPKMCWCLQAKPAVSIGEAENSGLTSANVNVVASQRHCRQLFRHVDHCPVRRHLKSENPLLLR